MDKKVSFGFSKVVKKPQLLNKPSIPAPEEKIELIECLEGQTIKVSGGTDNLQPETPLVIPVIANSTPLEKRKQLREDARAEKEDEGQSNAIEPAKDETLEDRAAREILQSLKATEDDEAAAATFTVPLTADELKLGGARESTMDDYEDVPITQFGLAMLRGMGWKDEVHKKKEKRIEDEIIVCRPKGLGLGADKAMKQQVKLATNSSNTADNLVMKRDAYVRIIAGKHKDYYGRVEGMDDESGRVFIKLALGGNRESINEGFVKLVTEKEYKENRKVLNVAKYEEYKIKTETKTTSQSDKGRDKDRDSPNSRSKTTTESRSPESRRDREYKEYRDRSQEKEERRDSSKYRSEGGDRRRERERSRSRDKDERNGSHRHRYKDDGKHHSKRDKDYKSYSSKKDSSRRDR